jgi:hypothetical protein
VRCIQNFGGRELGRPKRRCENDVKMYFREIQDVAMKFQNDFIVSIPVCLHFTERGHLLNTPLE